MSLAVIALVAAADGSIDDSEVVTVQELYAKHGRGLVDAATVQNGVQYRCLGSGVVVAIVNRCKKVWAVKCARIYSGRRYG
jgi:hypothetical protein